jgi:predicted DCC family thiol-disulfide oxidoreductase YuxK
MPEVSTRANSYRDDPAVPAFDDSRPLFVFDGVCVLCSGGASWVMRVDREARVNFTPAQGLIGRALYIHYRVEMDETYMLIANGRAFTASRGYLELCRILGGGWRILRVAAIIPEPLRDRVYALIARNRYRWFGKAGYCELLTAAQRRRLLRTSAEV